MAFWGTRRIDLENQLLNKGNRYDKKIAMGETVGEKILGTAFTQLHKSEAVEKAVNRARARGGKFEDTRINRINRYLERFKEIDSKPEPQRASLIEALKEILHKDVIVKPEDFPQSYFILQQKIARERGLGNIEITEEIRRQWTETVIAEQERSFDVWIDYLASKDAPYPMWFKYYVLASVARMSLYDKEKHEFRKRDKTTTAIFPDINREALAYVYDSLVKVHITQEWFDEENWQNLLKKSKFAPLYAYAIEKVTPATHEEKKILEGGWVKYSQGSDYKPLCASLQGHGTGWCTAGEETAKSQLARGDFYVYYTKDSDGKNAVPRIAIRMENRNVAEVRGIDPHQELEFDLIDVAKEKYLQLPGGGKFEKKSCDMKRLTEIENKINDGKELSVDELSFLWEVDSRVEGFGFSSDPRIRELRSRRDKTADFVAIYKCKPKELALFADQLGKKRPYYAGGVFDLALFIGRGKIEGESLVFAWNIVESSKGGASEANELAGGISRGKIEKKYLKRALAFIESHGDKNSASQLASAISGGKLVEEDLTEALDFIEKNSSDYTTLFLADAIVKGVLTGDNLERAWKIIESKGESWVIGPLTADISENKLTGENLIKARRVLNNICAKVGLDSLY